MISRAKHYAYVLVFSLFMWSFIGIVIAGFIPVYYKTGECSCAGRGLSHFLYIDVSYAAFGAFGIIFGIVFSPILNRFMLVKISSYHDKEVPISWMARIGRAIIGWKAILFLLLMASIYIIEKRIYYKIKPHINTLELNKAGFKPIHCAAARNDVNKIIKIIDNGVDPNIEDIHGNTALHFAVNFDSRDAGLVLIKKGANVNAQNKHKATSLNLAVMDDNIRFVRLLVNNGASLSIQDKYGRVPFHNAAKYSGYAILKFFLQAGANIDKRDIIGQTALHAVVFDNKDRSSMKLKLLNLLIENGINVNAKDDDGATALHLAALKPDKNIVEFLIEKGANINITTNKGELPLHYAVKGQYKAIVGIIIKHESKLNVISSDGKSPLDYAIINATNRNKRHECNDGPEIIKLLRSYGGKTAEELKDTQ